MVKRLLMVVSLIVATMLFVLDARASQNSLQTLEQTTVVAPELSNAEIQCKYKGRRARIVVIRDATTGKVIAVYIIHEDYWEPCM